MVPIMQPGMQPGPGMQAGPQQMIPQQPTVNGVHRHHSVKSSKNLYNSHHKRFETTTKKQKPNN